MPLRDDAQLTFQTDLGCDPKRRRRMYTAWCSQIEGCWVPSVHANCNHNEIAALLKRSLAPTPLADERSRLPVLREFKKLRNIARRYGGYKWSHLETAESYTGLLRRRYVEAERSLRTEGAITGADSLLGAFLKAEKFGTAKYGKPRMIFPRSPRYNLALASFLKPFEHWLWGNLTARRLFNGSNTRVVAKGLNGEQRANLILKKFKLMGECVCFEVDGSAFEAHVDVWQLEQEAAVYLAAYSGDHELAALLARQRHNEGYTANGVRFSRFGGRASGDFNTGMGNTIVMLCVVVSVLRHLKVPFDTLADGDNALVFLRPKDIDLVLAYFAPLARQFSGHEMVLERPVRVYEEVRFGQSAPVQVSAERWTMVRDYRKVLSQLTSNHAHLNERKQIAKYLRSVALCELSLNAGLPIVQNLAARLLSITDASKPRQEQVLREYQARGVDLDTLHKTRFVEPTDIARRSYERAFGVTPERQLLIEKHLSQVSLTDEAWVPEDSPWEGALLDARPGLVDQFYGVGL